jgi:short-subunit dehydrogenase
MSSSTSPEEVVGKALRVLARGGGLSIPGALNKFSVFAQRLIPSRVVPMLVAKLSKA